MESVFIGSFTSHKIDCASVTGKMPRSMLLVEVKLVGLSCHFLKFEPLNVVLFCEGKAKNMPDPPVIA